MPDPEVMPKQARSRFPPLERPENVLQQAMDSLANPVAAAVDPAQAQAELEETRQKILEGAKKIAAAQAPANLRRFRMKLNPEKCTFGVPAGKLLGFLVSSRGIEVNPTKIRAIERMELPKCLNDVQKFTGCLASLSRFVCRLGEKALPLYQLMKKSDKFV